MNDVRNDREFDAHLPHLDTPVRIRSFDDARVFARRWAIRDKDLAVRALVRQLDKVNSSEAAERAIRDLKRELAARGLMSRQ